MSLWWQKFRYRCNVMVGMSFIPAQKVTLVNWWAYAILTLHVIARPPYHAIICVTPAKVFVALRLTGGGGGG